jgi:hypothetical protein
MKYENEVSEQDALLIEKFEASKVDLTKGGVPRSVADSVAAYVMDVLRNLRNAEVETKLQALRAAVVDDPVAVEAAMTAFEATRKPKPPIKVGGEVEELKP